MCEKSCGERRGTGGTRQRDVVQQEEKREG